MTIKEREAIFKLNELVKQATQPVLTTNTALTGQVQPTPQIQPGVMPLPPLAPNQG